MSQIRQFIAKIFLTHNVGSSFGRNLRTKLEDFFGATFAKNFVHHYVIHFYTWVVDDILTINVELNKVRKTFFFLAKIDRMDTWPNRLVGE
jgi:hypothetical protein